MKPVDVLEWTMGWAWPVITVLAVLIFIGIERIVNWDTQELSQNTTPVCIPKRRYVWVRSTGNNMRTAGNFKHREKVLVRSARLNGTHSRKKVHTI
jgi:hypothetical protein